VGTWGFGIFEDDMASDVRGEFEDAIAEGLGGNAATQRVFEVFGDAVEDYDDGPVFWLSLAAIQLERGILQSDVRENALAAITPNLERWEEAGPDEMAQRKVVLDELRVRLEGAG
jgi:hypothetical protein